MTWLIAQARPPLLRTIGQFAEEEIIVPTGTFEGRRFRIDRQPYAGLFFREIDSGRWRRIFSTGPNQDGKTLHCFTIPLLWLLFEWKQTTILGVPSLDLVADKWKADILPAIKSSRYKDLLPASGGGSRDGESSLFEFGNGARLRFMTAGGADHTRAGFTSRNLVVTESDGFDVVGGSSREGTKFDQLERRLLSYEEKDSRVIAECTVTTEAGRVWQEYKRGSQSRIALQCPHCGKWVTPEREHFRGWQDARSENEAAANAFIACPTCGAAWTNEQRIEANRRAVLVHSGQDVAPDGTVTGPLPETNTLGFRWTAVNSLLTPNRLSKTAKKEWNAKRAADEEAAERDVCQSEWALPAKPAKVDVSALDSMVIMSRTLGFGRGVCPPGTQVVTVGCDVGKRLCHWVAIAWRPNATPHVVEYGRIEVPSDGENAMDEEQAILLALRDWRDELEGWKCEDRIIRPTFVFVDAGNWQNTIISFTTESGAPFFPCKGYGFGQRKEGGYRRETGSKVIGTREGYALVQLPDGRQYLEIKADHWKSWLHARLHTPLNKPGAMTLFDGNNHLSFAKHLTAERQVEEFSPGEGTVIRWEAVSRNNHYLDATCLACVAGHEAGMRLIEVALPAVVATSPAPTPTPHDRPEFMPERPDRWMD